jgi:hypothetical protein
MPRYRFEVRTRLIEEEGQPAVIASVDVELPDKVAVGENVVFPIPGGVVFPERDKNGNCVCTNFGQCVHPNKPWNGRCSLDDLEEEAAKGNGPGGAFTFPVCQVTHSAQPGVLTELYFGSRGLGGRGMLDMFKRAGFAVTVLPKNAVSVTDAEDGDEEEEDDAGD